MFYRNKNETFLQDIHDNRGRIRCAELWAPFSLSPKCRKKLVKTEFLGNVTFPPISEKGIRLFSWSYCTPPESIIVFSQAQAYPPKGVNTSP